MQSVISPFSCCPGRTWAGWIESVCGTPYSRFDRHYNGSARLALFGCFFKDNMEYYEDRDNYQYSVIEHFCDAISKICLFVVRLFSNSLENDLVTAWAQDTVDRHRLGFLLATEFYEEHFVDVTLPTHRSYLRTEFGALCDALQTALRVKESDQNIVVFGMESSAESSLTAGSVITLTIKRDPVVQRWRDQDQ